MKKVGFIRKNGIFDKISGFFAIYRKGYYNKQKEQSPQDWRRTAMEEGNAKSLVRRLPIKNRITLMVILISVVPILIISIFSYAKAFISVRQTVRAFAAQTLTSLERSLTNLADPSRLLAGGQEKLPEEVLKTEPTGLFQQEALRYLTGVTVLYTDGTVCSLAGEEILAVTESGGWAITQNEVGEQRLAVAWYATDGEGNAYTVQALFMPQMFTRLLDVYNEESCNRLVLVDGAGGLLTDDGTPLTGSDSTDSIRGKRGTDLPPGGAQQLFVLPYGAGIGGYPSLYRALHRDDEATAKYLLWDTVWNDSTAEFFGDCD